LSGRKITIPPPPVVPLLVIRNDQSVSDDSSLADWGLSLGLCLYLGWWWQHEEKHKHDPERTGQGGSIFNPPQPEQH
jgi:hypothetical protein